VRWWQLTLLVLVSAVAAVATTILAVAVNVATGGTAPWLPAVERHSLWWLAGTTAASAGAGLLVWAAQRSYDRGLLALVPAVQRPEPWVVKRPDEVGRIVAVLRRRHGRMVGVTAAVQGAGGFGKTTVAKMVCAEPRVLRRFGGRVYWVPLGRDVSRLALAGVVNGLIARIDPGRAVTFTDARQASEHLAAVLAAGPRRLLVLDDVWSEEQLSAFPVAGRCARLVTTRIPSLTAGAIVAVRVGQMSKIQARKLLLDGPPRVPQLPPAVVEGLLKETGQWPLLLRLVNKILADQSRLQPDITSAAEDLLGRLRCGGALQVDQLTGAAARPLDVSDPDARQLAVRATIQASTSLLSQIEYDRLAEIAVFSRNETIPTTLLATLWQATGGRDRIATLSMCVRLAGLALLSLDPAEGGDGTVAMHDVIRDYLREHLGHARIIRLHQALLDAVAADLPTVQAANTGGGTVRAWWELPEPARYLREHLIEHMLQAGQTDQAEEVAADLRWVGTRLHQAGPAGPYADLAQVPTRHARRLDQVLWQAAHLLAPTSPPHSLIDILHSRVSHDPDWGMQARALSVSRKLPALINKWPLPDLPEPTLHRTLTDHTGTVYALAVSSDGAWLASGSHDQTISIWTLATGERRVIRTGLDWMVTALAVAPDDTWLASVSSDGSVQIWDPATGGRLAKLITGRHHRTKLVVAPTGTWLAISVGNRVWIWDPATGKRRSIRTGHTPIVFDLAAAPDGSWLASSGSRDGTIRIWDPATGQRRATLACDTWPVPWLAVAPDGTWLASDTGNGLGIWDPATGERRATLAGLSVGAVAVAPDSSWLAGAMGDHVAIWDTTTGERRATFTGHTGTVVGRLAVAPDGTWLAGTIGNQIQIWDVATGERRAALSGHTDTVLALAAIPGSTLLASAGKDQTVRMWDPRGNPVDSVHTRFVRPVVALAFAPSGAWLAAAAGGGGLGIWDVATGERRATFTDHNGTVEALRIAPDGSWLASASWNQLCIWDVATGERRATFTGNVATRVRLAAAPDGTWLASVSGDHVQIWDPATGEHRATLTGHTDTVIGLTAAPDGTWLASAAENEICIWDPATGERRATVVRARWSGADGLAAAPDSTWLAGVSGDQVQIWDPATGEHRATFTDHIWSVEALTVAPDGTWLASTAWNQLCIWDVATGKRRATLTHQTGRMKVAVARDGTWLASASGDHVQIWDPATGECRATLTGHTGPVEVLAVAPDDTWMASVGQDRTIRVWNLAADSISALMRVDRQLAACAWNPSGRSIAVGGDAGLYHFTFCRGNCADSGGVGGICPDRGAAGGAKASPGQAAGSTGARDS
jgi:WD40 repeat protein